MRSLVKVDTQGHAHLSYPRNTFLAQGRCGAACGRSRLLTLEFLAEGPLLVYFLKPHGVQGYGRDRNMLEARGSVNDL